MSLNSTVAKINNETMEYAPAVLAGVIAVEQAAKGQPGQAKQELVVNTIMAGAQAAQNVPIPQVQGIAALVQLFVTILNAAGLFKHAEPAKA